MKQAETNLETLGRRIAAARKAAGLNQAELANKIGTAQPRVAEWESGRKETGAMMLIEIIAATKADPAEIMRGLASRRYDFTDIEIPDGAVMFRHYWRTTAGGIKRDILIEDEGEHCLARIPFKAKEENDLVAELERRGLVERSKKVNHND